MGKDTNNLIDENIDKVVNEIKGSKYVYKLWKIVKILSAVIFVLIIIGLGVDLFNKKSSNNDYPSDDVMKAMYGSKYQSAEETEKLIIAHAQKSTNTQVNSKEWTIGECKTAVNAFQESINTTIIGKVQKGIRPTKAEACTLPVLCHAYLERCKAYDNPEDYKKIEEAYWGYKYSCDNWVE